MIGAAANHLWHCTLFALGTAVVALLLRRYQAKVRYWVWFAASVKFVIPFSVFLSVGAHIAPAPTTRMAVNEWASPVAVRLAQPFGVEALPSGTIEPVREGNAWMYLLALAWLCGSVAIGRKRWQEWSELRSALRASVEAPIETGIPVRFCPGLLEPSVVGWSHPVLLLPEGITEVLSPEQLKAVLTHELCHVRRKDNALALFHMGVELLFWFHPLVWWIGARLIAERERACDEEVLREGCAPFVYAEGILAVCRHYVHSPLAAASGVTGWSLKRRIEDIMVDRKFRELGRARIAVLITAAAGMMALPFVTGMLNAPLLLGQARSAQRFDSVSVRACKDAPDTKRGNGYSSSQGVLHTGCMPLADEHGLGLIQRAYVRFGGSTGSQWPAVVPVKGKAPWFETDLYEVVGKAASNTPQEVLEGPMLRSALEARFRLRVHDEPATIPAYALVADSSGPRLKSFLEGSCAPMPAAFPPPQLPAGQRYCMVRAGSRPPAIDAEGTTVSEFSKLLSLVVDRPVMDRTGLAGRFTIHLEFAPDASTPRFLAGGDLARFATPPSAGTLPVSRALGELGLRLEAGSGTQQQLVVDHVERPGG